MIFAMSMPMGVTSALFGLPEERIAENDVLIRKMIRSVVMPQDPVVVAEGRSATPRWKRSSGRSLSARWRTRAIRCSARSRGRSSRRAGRRGGVRGVVLTLILASYETTQLDAGQPARGAARPPRRDEPAA